MTSNTGDKGWYDADGYLHLSGRFKEIINRGAEKYSPFEVEEALASHPAVSQLIAFAVLQSTSFFCRRLCRQLALGRVLCLPRLRRHLLHLVALAVPQSVPFSSRRSHRRTASGDQRGAAGTTSSFGGTRRLRSGYGICRRNRLCHQIALHRVLCLSRFRRPHLQLAARLL